LERGTPGRHRSARARPPKGLRSHGAHR
jgi:hypothetical protein